MSRQRRRNWPTPDRTNVEGYSWTDAAYTKMVLRFHQLRIGGGNSPGTRQLRNRIDAALSYLETRLIRGMK